MIISKILNYINKLNYKYIILLILLCAILVLIFAIRFYISGNNKNNNNLENFNNNINNDNDSNSISNKKPIPKVIYMCHKDLTEIEKYSKNWKKLNPEYEIKLYNNQLCEEFLLKEFSQLHYDIFKFIPDGPIKADFWRVCIIYKYGGLYVDADIEPLVPLKDYIENDIDFATCISFNFSNDKDKWKFNPHFIMSRPNDKILDDCINKYIEYYNKKKQYYYWEWSICKLFIIKNVNEKKSGIHYDGNKKYQFLLELPTNDKGIDTCEYNGMIVLNNRYSNYFDHTFNDIKDE
jgi:mannosyltransferase OCH1-like enzyme